MIRISFLFSLLFGMFYLHSQTAVAGEIFKYLQIDADIARIDDQVAFTWEGDAWIGGDYNKGWFKTEGDFHGGELDEAEFQALYSHYLTRFFDVQVGLRHDFKPDSPDQTTYAVIGIQGLAPYWFEVDVPFFISEDGDISFRPEVEYEILFTQRLIAEIYFEGDFYFTENQAQGFDQGLSEIDTGLKIRYEIEREFAPYIDFNHIRAFGMTKTQEILAGEAYKDFIIRAGVSLMF